jgi:methylmalonyl-CoA/ethylmalonyl-CoA epimerase
MTNIKKIHHINFLVKDIDEGISRYRDLLGIDDFIREEIPERGVITARVALGEQWLVLVQPVDPDGTPGRHLAEHGEGFFLISYAVDSLQQAATRVTDHGSNMTSTAPRQGLRDWQVQDIDVKDTLGAQIQFCMEIDLQK